MAQYAFVITHKRGGSAEIPIRRTTNVVPVSVEATIIRTVIRVTTGKKNQATTRAQAYLIYYFLKREISNIIIKFVYYNTEEYNNSQGDTPRTPLREVFDEGEALRYQVDEPRTLSQLAKKRPSPEPSPAEPPAKRT